MLCSLVWALDLNMRMDLSREKEAKHTGTWDCCLMPLAVGATPESRQHPEFNCWRAGEAWHLRRRGFLRPHFPKNVSFADVRPAEAGEHRLGASCGREGRNNFQRMDGVT